MQTASRCILISIVMCLPVRPVSAHAQGRDRAAVPASANAGVSALAGGWAALAAGRHDEAAAMADGLLRTRPSDHAAADLKIEALCSSAPLKALDAYDTWLATTRIEDVFLIAPIARGILKGIASGQDRTLRWEAERRLAQDGDTAAAARLQEGSAAGRQNADDDLPLAMAGDAAAARRLLQQPSAAAQARPQALAKALPAAGPAAIPALRALLKDPAAPVRMEAALSLAKLGAVDAMADLEPLLNDPETRSFAAVALTRLGDANAEAVVREMLQSPVPDVRLLGAQAYEGKGSGPWVEALTPVLQDPNGLSRIRAAELLAPVAPDAALAVLLDASRDPNPVVRADVTRVLERSAILSPSSQASDSARGDGPRGLAVLRRLLRDAEPSVRVSAAGSILTLARGQ